MNIRSIWGNNFPQKQLGVLLGRRLSDYISGTIPYEVVLPDGDWRPFCPEGELQFSKFADSMGCVSFSNNNAAEIQLKQQGFDFDFSDRALATLSETTRRGNYQSKVADVPRKVGRILESDWPIPENFTWDTFYEEVPAEVKAKAILFEEKYEWLYTDAATLQKHLKQAPIQITIPGQNPYHAVTLVYVERGFLQNIFWYFDSYAPFLKSMTTSPASALKIVIKPMFSIQPKRVMKKDGKTFGVLLPTPNGDQIIYADTEAQWKSWSKPDSYGLKTTDALGNPIWQADIQLPF